MAAAAVKSRTRPLDDAMRRLLDLAARGAAISRMAREVGIIITEWRAVEEDAVERERIAEMLEQLDTGVFPPLSDRRTIRRSPDTNGRMGH